MIYSKSVGNYVPVRVTKTEVDERFFGKITRYNVFDKDKEVGYVRIQDSKNGIWVDYIENLHPKEYSGFGKIADQIEVEHCLNKGLKDFSIKSFAGLNSHAFHYLRGKRFSPNKLNDQVKRIIENTPKGQMFNTEFLGDIDMYMPIQLIKKYIEIIKKSPLLK